MRALILSLLCTGVPAGVYAVPQSQETESVQMASPQLQWSRGLASAMKPPSEAQVRTYANGSVRAAKQDHDLRYVKGSRDHVAGNQPSVQQWSILMADKTLYRTLRRWAQDANYQLLWQIDRDYPIEAAVTFNNDFRDALGEVMAGVALTDYPIQAIFNPTARVVRIVRHMDEGWR